MGQPVIRVMPRVRSQTMAAAVGFGGEDDVERADGFIGEDDKATKGGEGGAIRQDADLGVLGGRCRGFGGGEEGEGGGGRDEPFGGALGAFDRFGCGGFHCVVVVCRSYDAASFVFYFGSFVASFY